MSKLMHIAALFKEILTKQLSAKDSKSFKKIKLKQFLRNNQALFGRNIQKCHEQTVFLVPVIDT